jgi:Asp-tRNA(Asn)/Glu-tRNA(Gln) amidotransferase A subunit family amidase
LRQCRQLDGIDPRYDPTVIPLPQPGDEAPASYTDKSNLHVPPDDFKARRFYSIKDFHNAYSSGALTPTDVVERLLPLIRRDVAQRSACSTAFMDSKVDLIRHAAEASTGRYRQGRPLGVLDGVPFGVKDDLQAKEYKRYIGTIHDYSNGGDKETSWCAKMLEEEGAILVGTLTMHELGMGG